jgi:hypothetical protein
VHYEVVAMAGRHCLPAKLSPAMEATTRNVLTSDPLISSLNHHNG